MALAQVGYVAGEAAKLSSVLAGAGEAVNGRTLGAHAAAPPHRAGTALLAVPLHQLRLQFLALSLRAHAGGKRNGREPVRDVRMP